MTIAQTSNVRSPDPAEDLTLCDREPIHVPGAIQPHGLLFVVNPATLHVSGGAGDIEGRLADDWLGRPLGDLIRQDAALLASRAAPGLGVIPGTQVEGRSEVFDVSVHRSGPCLVVELEPAPSTPPTAAAVLGLLDSTSTSFERAPDLAVLCERAAVGFRMLTGFDRVMIYRFLEDGAGSVLAEDRDPALLSFLNHHFPATDIPVQARALYVRNRVRVIPDVDYTPQPLRPDPAGLRDLDLSDAALRSVSPIHIQYLKNMGVAASASISIVRDGLLWGLIACHHRSPKQLTFDVRAACSALAGGLARQIRAKEEAETFRERTRLRGVEDLIVGQIGADEAPGALLERMQGELRRMLAADGFASVHDGAVRLSGLCPPEKAVGELAAWVRDRFDAEPLATASLPAEFPPAAEYADAASGLLAVVLPTEERTVLMWFRAEEIEVIEWAGNPHKDVARPKEVLTPRASFAAWKETVRGRARPWTLGEVQAAGRLRRALYDARQNRRLRELNRELSATIADNESLLRQKDFLIKEVNHRVQNSLQLVSSFLGLQARASDNPALAAELAEAQRRLSAVGLVHRRLYRDDQVEAVDLSRYIEELSGDMKGWMGDDWSAHISLALSPVLISADRAVNVGLILTELVINANKYAYGGAAGPITIGLEEHRHQFRLIVADHGSGLPASGEGIGTRMMKAMVERLSGTLEYLDNAPGLRAILTAPIAEPARRA